MQCRAYLESLFHYTNIEPENVIIVCYDIEDPSYQDIVNEFDKCLWVSENNGYNQPFSVPFDHCLRHTISTINDSDYILFGTDDVIVTDFINLDHIEDYLNKDSNIIGFSLRLGKNILGSSKINNISDNDNMLKWEWRKAISHWSYPIDVSCSIYKASLIKEVINYSQEILPIPNSLESRAVNLVYQDNTKPQYYSSFNSPKMIIRDLNIVQKLFISNRFQGDNSTTLERLNEQYMEGYRIDWHNDYKFNHYDCFVGMKNFKLINKDQV